MLRDIRNNYDKHELTEAFLDKNPITFFKRWMEEAIKNQVNEPTAMVLSTVSNRQPDSRIVLLKEVREEGFVFFTNYDSEKGNQLKENPYVALNFFWAELERQVRIRGKVEKLAEQDSIDYFASRPRDSKIGAWASKQSQQVPNRDTLELQFAEAAKEFGDEDIPKPVHWGGYLVKAQEIEFWQGRPNRLHDRIRFKLKNGQWSFQRLQS